MNKAKFVSDWIKNKVASGTPASKLAIYFVCSKSSVSNLKNMNYPNSPLTGKAFEIIKAMEKEDWPTWQTVREAEKEMRPKPSNDELSRAVRKVDEQGFMIVEINEKCNKLNANLNRQSNQIAELKSDVYFVMDISIKELADRITALQEMHWQLRTGLIRKLWRWLW